MDKSLACAFHHFRCATTGVTIGLIYKVARKADFCLVPSIWDETLGLVGMEMMALGVPLIVSSRARVSEFVENEVTGLVFNPDTENSLYQLIVRVISQPDLAAALRTNLANRRRQLKTFGEHITQMEDLFRNVVYEKRKKRNHIAGL